MNPEYSDLTIREGEVHAVPKRKRAEQRLTAAMLYALHVMDGELRREPVGFQTLVMRLRVRMLRARVLALGMGERGPVEGRCWGPARLAALGLVAVTAVGVVATVPCC